MFPTTSVTILIAYAPLILTFIYEGLKYMATDEFRPSEAGLNVSSMIIMAAIVAVAQNADFIWSIACLFAGMTCFGYYLTLKAKRCYEEFKLIIPSIIFGAITYGAFIPLGYGILSG